MSDRPTHKSVTCPQCAAPFERAIVWFDGREIMADRGCLCDTCEERRAAAVAAASAEERHLELWKARAPEDYHRAATTHVQPALHPALAWRPSAASRRLGLWGPPGTGKSMAAALIVRAAGVPFRWISGFSARAAYNTSVTGDGEARKRATTTWLRLLEADLLVLDDVDKGNFTEAWASALYDILEARNGNCLPTIWTANHGPDAMSRKMAKCGDHDLADSIERRLCGGAAIYQSTIATP